MEGHTFPEVSLKAKDLMKSPAVTARRETSIENLAKIMYDKGIGSVIIVDEDGRLEGIVTERDIIYAVAKDKVGKEFPAYTIMTENPITVRPGDSLTSVVKLMKENRIRHIPVVDESGKPLGMISLRDVLDFIMLMLSFVRGGGS